MLDPRPRPRAYLSNAREPRVQAGASLRCAFAPPTRRNSLIRWLGLLRSGLASGRATFLWMEGPLPAPARRGKVADASRHQNFDLGEYFEALGADWRWTAQREATVRAVLGASAQPARLQYKGFPGRDDRFSLSWADAHGRTRAPLHGNRTDEHAGALIAFLTGLAEPWVVVDLRPKYMTAFEHSRGIAAAVLSGQLGRAWGGGWGDVCGAARDTWSGYSQERHFVPTSASVFSGHGVGTPGPFRGNSGHRGRMLTTRINARCEAFALLRPRRSLQQKLVPLLRRLEGNLATRRARSSTGGSLASSGHGDRDNSDGTGAVVGIHVRTGLADWQSLAPKTPPGARAWRQAVWEAAQHPLPFEERWKRFEAMLSDCSTWNSILPDRPQRGRDDDGDELARVRGGHASPACFDWPRHLPPTLSDGLRCATESGATSSARRRPLRAALRQQGAPADRIERDVRFNAPSNGTLAAVFACAMSFATHPKPVSAKWRLLVLGDSPALIRLASAHPQLRDAHVVHTAAAGSLGHTAFGTVADASGHASSPAADPRAAWTRSMVDLYLAGVCDGFVSALFSSFPAAALSRSLLCCGHKRRHFNALSSTRGSNRDHPMVNSTFLAALL